MKSKNSMPLLWSIIVSTLILTIITGFARESAYSKYGIQIEKEPLLTVLMQGVGDGIMPWDRKDYVVKKDPAPITEDKPESTLPTEEVTLPESVPEKELIPIFAPVSHDYFDDALFIGDSRTVGLADYSTLDKSTFYAKVSSTIYNILDDPFIEAASDKMSIRQALSQKRYGKIYLMVGINELGTGTADTFLDQYRKVVEDIRILQPDSIIIIQSIMHVTTEKSLSDKIFNNENINERNEKIKTLADNKKVFYLDINIPLDDVDGGLNPDLSFDAVHLKASRYHIWEEYLLQNGVVYTESVQ